MARNPRVLTWCLPLLSGFLHPPTQTSTISAHASLSPPWLNSVRLTIMTHLDHQYSLPSHLPAAYSLHLCSCCRQKAAPLAPSTGSGYSVNQVQTLSSYVLYGPATLIYSRILLSSGILHMPRPLLRTFSEQHLPSAVRRHCSATKAESHLF